MLARLAELDAEHANALAGGGPRYVQRHRARGKLMARERIELLIDPDSPFLELSPLAGYGTGFPVGGSVVTGVGVVCDTECVLIASDPTVRGGSTNPWTLRKSLRASDIALRNRLPLINLVESGGADLPTQKEIFIPGGQVFRDLTRMSAAGIPTIALVFGSSTAGGAYLPGMSDYVVMVQDRAKVFLGGPPLVKMATGEDELLGVVPEDLKVPFDPREVIGRIVDGSDFDEFKPLYGGSLVTGWAALHGFPVGILANARGVLFSEESQKAAQFIQLANQIAVPLLFLQNTTGYMVGSHYEQAGIIKHGAMMINAVSNSRVPHLTVVMGASYGAGNYGMCGRAYDPRFLFTWPSAKSAVMGPAQLAGVLSIVGRQAAAARGDAYDEAADAAMRAAVEEQIESESQPFFLSGRIYDDGVIDPRDTRTVLGMCLSAIQNGAPGWGPGGWGPAGWGAAAGPAAAAVAGQAGYGVFRL